jgi:hypothetical protein
MSEPFIFLSSSRLREETDTFENEQKWVLIAVETRDVKTFDNEAIRTQSMAFPLTMRHFTYRMDNGPHAFRLKYLYPL